MGEDEEEDVLVMLQDDEAHEEGVQVEYTDTPVETPAAH